MNAALLLALSICAVALQPPTCSRRRGVRRRAGEDDSVPQPDPIYSDEAVVALCMNALGRNDDPIPDAGLRTCWNFSSDMCRAAVGGSLADFLKYARNPTFAQLVDHESWSGKLGNRIPASQTRGALTTTMVTVQTNRGQERKFLWTLVPVRKSTSELGLRRWRGAPETLFPHRLQQQRRPPDQGCWLVHECLYVENAIEQTL